MEIRRNMTLPEFRDFVTKQYGESHLLDLLKKMPDNWHFADAAKLLPGRELPRLILFMNLNNNDLFYEADESYENREQALRNERDQSETDTLELTIQLSENASNMLFPIDHGHDYETDVLVIERDYHNELRDILLRFAAGEDFELTYDDDFDEDEDDLDEDDFEDEYFEDEEEDADDAE